MRFFNCTFRAICFLVFCSISLYFYNIRIGEKKTKATWRLECELGVIADPDCPVDGGWSPWGPWSPCRGSCEDTGHRIRARSCNNPAPSGDGIPCNGRDQENELCIKDDCTIEDFRELATGDPARNEALRRLEAIPALLERCLQMQCPYEAIEAALNNDNTWLMSTEAVWNSLQCVKHNLGCAVVGEWGPWGKWSSCGSRCGPGVRWRLRRCDSPPPSDEQLVCAGTPLQFQPCRGDQCALDDESLQAIEPKPSTWSPWGAWSTCSERCGKGVRRRRRTCIDNTDSTENNFLIWGTHCRGQHDQLEICENNVCTLDGGWSGWGPWGACSDTCGAGTRSRSRSCTRPVRAGDGIPCIGPKVEVGTCHLSPCDVHLHNVAVLNGESFLSYNFGYKRSTLLHFFIRFMPLSPHGTLVRRGSIHEPFVRLSMQQWHVCLDARGNSQSCLLPRLCSLNIIEPAAWHNALVTITSEAGTLRLDDSVVTLKSSFPCDPELSDEPVHITIGEKFHGAIQELIVNFMPLHMYVEKHKRLPFGFAPSALSNVAFEKPSKEEAYITLKNDQFLRLPCFDKPNDWKIQLTIKPKSESGVICFIENLAQDNSLSLELQNMKIKLRYVRGDLRAETSSSVEIPVNQWLDITLSQISDKDAAEAIINSEEKLHVIVLPDLQPNSSLDMKSTSICNNEFFIGGLPTESTRTMQDFVPLTGIIASIAINGNLEDLHQYSIERYKDETLQVSSRAASLSGSYHETTWGMSNRLNLTCLHARTSRSIGSNAQWLFLDTSISGVVKDKAVRSLDDGRVLRLVATADKELRGFYSCRARSNRRTRNVVTYGVLGNASFNFSSTNTITVIAVITTICLVIGTLGWLTYEGITDLKDGCGFFRDSNATPQEEAEAVCRYIDKHMDLIGSKSAAKLAKAKARRKGRELARGLSYGAQEPQGLLRVVNNIRDTSEDSLSINEPEDLPALPETKTISGPCNLMGQEVYNLENTYFDSPRNSSMVTLQKPLQSSSSNELASRVLCSQLMLARKISSSKENVALRKNKSRSRNSNIGLKSRSNLLTIKSSSCIYLSPAQKVLQKFRELKSKD